MEEVAQPCLSDQVLLSDGIFASSISLDALKFQTFIGTTYLTYFSALFCSPSTQRGSSEAYYDLLLFCNFSFPLPDI